MVPRRSIGATRRPMTEAGPEALLHSKPSEQKLKQKQTRVRGQVLILKVQYRYRRGFTADLRSAKLHGERPPWAGEGVILADTILPTFGPLFQCICMVFLEVTGGEIYRQGSVLSSFNLDRASRAQGAFRIATGRFTSPPTPTSTPPGPRSPPGARRSSPPTSHRTL